MDALFNGDNRSKRIVVKISRWVEAHHKGRPRAIRAGYDLNGTPLPNSNYFSTAFVAPFGVAAMNNPEQQEWLNKIYKMIRDKRQNYYEDSINLLSQLVITGNFWNPTNSNHYNIKTGSDNH